MSYDAYDLCPCGSGKKLKFCCLGVIDEIEKAEQHQANHQSQAYSQVVERMVTAKPQFAWGQLSWASILLSRNELAAATEVLEKMEATHADHPLRLTMLASSALAQFGYEASRPVLYQALRKLSGQDVNSDVHVNLLMQLAELMEGRSHYLSARQHLAAAMRFATNAQRENVFMTLLEFDGKNEIPYLLRSVHNLIPITSEDADVQKMVRRAERSAALACFERSVRAYEHLVAADDQQADLWWNLGLVQAWDANEVEAARCWHRAAELTSDSETAVEYEALAQLLDSMSSVSPISADSEDERASCVVRIKSVGKTLTLLEEAPQLQRVEDPDEESSQMAARFTILNRPLTPEMLEADSWEQLPLIIGRVMVALTGPDDRFHIYAEAFTGGSKSLDELVELLGDEVIEQKPTTRDLPVGGVVSYLQPMLLQLFEPQEFSPAQVDELERQRWLDMIEQHWLQTAQPGLDGKSPLEAVGDKSLRVRLAAAVVVLEAWGVLAGKSTDMSALREQLQVPEPAPLPTTDDLSFNTLSVMSLCRLVLTELNDDQLRALLNRAMLVRYEPLLLDVLTEVRRRPQCWEAVDQLHALTWLSLIAQKLGNREEGLKYLREAQEAAAEKEDGFEQVLKLQIRELTLLAEDPEDPRTLELYQQLQERYNKKIPGFDKILQGFAERAGMKVPQSVAVGGVSGTVTDGGIWTPEAPGDKTGEATQKLWLPGED